MSDPTTRRAQRRQAVADGRESDAVERRTPRSNPGGRGSETTRRDRQRESRREIADELDIDREGVGAVERIAGLDVFLRSTGVRQFGDDVRQEFAGEADFVESDDVDPRVDGQRIAADPIVDSDRRSTVAQRARQQTAADAEFITDDDLDAEVGRRGVTGIEVAEDRRPDVAQRARRGFAEDDPFAEPDDFEIEVGQLGIEQAGLTEDGERRRAGRQFESETPLSSVDPFDDLTEDDDGFGLREPVQRRAAARGFEDSIGLFDSGDLDPESDIRDIDDGFGLGRDPARQVAAQQLDDQFDGFSIGPGDIELRETDSGEFEGVFEREVSR